MLALVQLLALLPLLLTTSAGPITKRYNRAYIVSGRDGKCLNTIPRNGVGAAVTTVDCSQAVQWDINPGSGSVIVSGTNLALDAGSNPGNNGALKVWTSYPTLYQQTWYLTGDNRIAITGGNQCLDEGDNGPQTYQCTTGNTNQVWYVRESNTPPSSSVVPSSSVAPSPSSSSSSITPAPSQSSAPGGIPVGAVYPDPPNGGRRIHPVGRNDLCLSVIGGQPGNGAEVDVTYCFPNDSGEAQYQLWDLPAKGSSGLIKLHGAQNFCFDAGSNPSNNVDMKVWQCYEGLFQQTWTFSNSGTFSLSNNQCLDVRMGSQPGNQKPFASVRDLQTYQCYAGNTNQMFQLYN